jgi:hypothetical protein
LKQEAEIVAQIRETIAQLERDRAAWFKGFAENFERDAAASMRAFVDAYSQRKCGFSGI